MRSLIEAGTLTASLGDQLTVSSATGVPDNSALAKSATRRAGICRRLTGPSTSADELFGTS